MVRDSNAQVEVPYLMRVIVGALGVVGVLGIARVWALGRGEFDDVNAIAAWAGAVVALFFAYKVRANIGVAWRGYDCSREKEKGSDEN